MIKKKQDISDVTKESILDGFIQASTEHIADSAKNTTTSLLGDLLIDTTAGAIPGIGGALQGIKLKRLEKNIHKLIFELASRLSEVNEDLKKRITDHDEQLNEAFEYIFEYAAEEKQEEKIKYMVNGFLNLAKYDGVISNEFIITYYDVLKTLRLIDIGVLKFMYDVKYRPFDNEHDLKDLLNTFNINYDQYQSVRVNLERMGLLSTKIQSNIVKDLDEISDKIDEIHKYLSVLDDPKKLKRLSKPKSLKFKSTDKFEISKFGREFVKFFIEEEKKNGEDY
ncbi:hypothetical protein ERX37_00165 [Macrococcus hajekii]|uniref:Uncharacterized protein n=1 Tax=Macrococcus hajekii TaxID=198482 RepID=A0A4R6BLA5_9STAP|nr:hypothetical protein [Macrococcus hajekii]TDM02546.1 hypothetical protein ERX37_00165 [Macrococcus hajekii]GGB01838.1 hypothetical protein GCM10007190_07290 [Macrococcus hajekii]